MEYREKLDEEIVRYFEVLEPKYPKWLDEYIHTKEMLDQNRISVTCGTIYSKLFESDFFYSSLDHSVAVALIIWHFTKDKKQTLAGLFHDISTPVFKHCVDFMNKDYIKQESTEEDTGKILRESNEIMKLLERDNIKVEEVENYQMYKIADNNTPQLSADRLEYSLSNAIFTYEINSLEEIKIMYENIDIGKNEENEEELEFLDEEIAEKFVSMVCKLSKIYIADKTRYSMQFMADVLKKMNDENIISKKDFYKMSEAQIIEKIQKSKYAKEFNIWKNATSVTAAIDKPDGKYSVKIKVKIRYIDPLVKNIRISKINERVNRSIKEVLDTDMEKYVYLE